LVNILDLMNKLHRSIFASEILIKLNCIKNKSTDNEARLIMTQELHGNEQEDAIL